MYQSLRMLATAQDFPSKPNLPVCAVALSPWFPCGFVLLEYRLIELNLNGGQTNSKYIFWTHHWDRSETNFTTRNMCHRRNPVKPLEKSEAGLKLEHVFRIVSISSGVDIGESNGVGALAGRCSFNALKCLDCVDKTYINVSSKRYILSYYML